MFSSLISLYSFLCLAGLISLDKAIPPPSPPPQIASSSYILQAVQVSAPPKIDGILESEIWNQAPTASNFIQKQPYEGEPATESTEVKILYTEEVLYIGVMCHDSEPEKIIATIKRRDSEDIYDNDHIRILLDTFHDRRNGYVFVTNPLGARLDLQVRKEGKREGGRLIANPNINTDWNGVWDVKSAVIDTGWSCEIEIPLKSLRFNEHTIEGWGINVLRNIRRKNEESTWTPLPRNLEFYKISMAGSLMGLEGLKKGLNLQLKPYTLANRISQQDISGGRKSTSHMDAGLDIKYGLTSNITADLTVNTDFSQVEADDQQINLTRFSLYYPEKREFFLENSAIFSIGSPEDAMIFFSRRIGLSSQGEEIPILGGVKVAGKAGRYNIGLMHLRTGEKENLPSNNFSTLRISRDIWGQSAVGFMIANRQSSISKDYNRAFCLDGDFVFGENFSMGGYLAVTATPGLKGRNTAAKLGFQWISDLWDVYGYFFDIQENFNAEMGYVRRTGIRRAQIHVGYTPEPKIPGVRRINPHIFFAYTTDRKEILLLRESHVHMSVDLINGGNFGIQWNQNHEFVDFPFPIQQDITIPVGLYTYPSWKLDFTTDKSRRLFSAFSYRWGEFYGGKSKIYDISGGFRPFSHFSGLVSLVYNDISLPQGAFTNHLLRTKLIFDFSTRLFLMSLIQWNSDTDQVDMNWRLNFIFRPGSHIYLVFNECRLVEGIAAGIRDRTLALKFNYLFNL